MLRRLAPSRCSIRCHTCASVFCGTLRHGQPVHDVENALQRGVVRPAFAAFFEMLFVGEGIARRVIVAFAVVKQNQLFFTQVIHFAVLAKGSRALLNFCTARNTLCLAAPGWQPSTRLTSSMHMPSKCRRTNAVRSEGLKSVIASATRSRTWPLMATRSGAGSWEGRERIGIVHFGIRRGGQFVPPFTGADQIERTVYGDAIEPGAEARTLVEAGELLVRPQEAVLHDILRVLLIASHTICQPEQWTAVALHEHTKRVGIARPRLGDQA